MPLTYHAGQRAVQDEANTRAVADRLAAWSGPVTEFALGADLVLLALPDGDGVLRFHSLAGAPPLVEAHETGALRLPLAPAALGVAGDGARCGGLVINLGQTRRARVNGVLAADGPEACLLTPAETFTLCRKYLAPSLPAAAARISGPLARESLALADPWLAGVVGEAETSFLASISPDGGPDVAHRGGPPGFLVLDAAARTLTWPEYLGDGVFKSAGNVRATGTLTLLVIDIATGDAAEMTGTGAYTNVRAERRPREAALLQERDPFPVQGTISCALTGAARLRGFMHPRTRIEKAIKVTSQSTVAEQSPR